VFEFGVAGSGRWEPLGFGDRVGGAVYESVGFDPQQTGEEYNGSFSGGAHAGLYVAERHPADRRSRCEVVLGPAPLDTQGRDSAAEHVVPHGLTIFRTSVDSCQASWQTTRTLRGLVAAMTDRALITGITGQDGSYLAELLLEKGYQVTGVVRRSSTTNFERIAHLLDDIGLEKGDLLDELSLTHIIREHRPTEVYNLGAQSFVETSFTQPIFTGDTTGLGVARILEAIRLVDPDIRFYQASTSEVFGKVYEVPQTETTPFHPRSPYGVAKAYGHWITQNYRESYGIHASNGILFNHESPRRGLDFLPRKISHAVARITLGREHEVWIGNLDAQRDWGHAADYVRAMWLMLQQDQPGDYVIATGETHSVRELCQVAFDHAGLNWEDHVRVDERYFRPAEVDLLIGDASKARLRLGWEPTVGFEELVTGLVDADIELMTGKLDTLA
jgi:GDPmannose 4,6-dehydratase